MSRVSADTRCGTIICTWRVRSIAPNTLADRSRIQEQDSDSTFAASLLIGASRGRAPLRTTTLKSAPMRSEEHTSELQSQSNLVCRLLLEKKKKQTSDLTD